MGILLPRLKTKKMKSSLKKKRRRRKRRRSQNMSCLNRKTHLKMNSHRHANIRRVREAELGSNAARRKRKYKQHFSTFSTILFLNLLKWINYLHHARTRMLDVFACSTCIELWTWRITYNVMCEFLNISVYDCEDNAYDIIQCNNVFIYCCDYNVNVI